MMIDLAKEVIGRCIELARHTEEPGRITRTFLSAPMRAVHSQVGEWMRDTGLEVSVDAAGNIRGIRGEQERRLIIGSHLDTVPNAGAFDGILGVMIGIALAKVTAVPLAVVGFSEEEGVRFGLPFIGSRALIGTAQPLFDADPRIADAIRAYGLDPGRLVEAMMSAAAYLEFHIEQGPVLEHLGMPLGVVEAIAGQSRWTITFTGAANHAGTTPMHLRADALACAAEWISAVEQAGLAKDGLVATVGRCEVEPGAGNVVPGRVTASLDVRHKDDGTRRAALEHILTGAREIGARRGVSIECKELLELDATPMNALLVDKLASTGIRHRMTSGAGHDAMVMAKVMPSAMLFMRSPGGISHHPDESVLAEDVAAALECGKQFVENWHG
jgi:allantoate deiminase